MAAFPLFSRRNASTIHLWTMCTLVAVMLFASSAAAFAQASKKSSPASSSRPRPISTTTRVASNVASDAMKATQPASSDRMTIERVNELTGFEPASEEEVKLLVEKMKKAIAEKDVTTLLTCFSDRARTGRLLAGVNVTDGQLEACVSADLFWPGVAKSVRSSSTNFELVRLTQRGSEFRPLFRRVTASLGLSYSEYMVHQQPSRSAIVVDEFSYAGGDYLSLYSRSILLAQLTSPQNPIRIGPEGVEAEVLEASDTMFRFAAHCNSKNLSTAISELNSCPESIRSRPGILVQKCRIARGVSKLLFRQCTEELSTQYPNTPMSDLMLLEVARLFREESDQLQIADRLMKTFDDPFLNYYRVKGLVKAGRMDEARQAMDAAKRAAPTFVDVHVADVELRLIEGDHARTKEAIEAVESEFGGDVLNLASHDGFESFSQSAIGRAFLAKRAGFEF